MINIRDPNLNDKKTKIYAKIYGPNILGFEGKTRVELTLRLTLTLRVLGFSPPCCT